jgi:nucleoside-diphosphate-sugar epimerase
LKLFVTGGNGFTGKHLKCLARLKNFEVYSYEKDINDKISLSQELLNFSPEYVIHLAGISFVGHQLIRDFYNVNLMGTLNLLDCLSNLKNKPKSILITSSANVYGDLNQEPIQETQYLNPKNHYASSKASMEIMTLNYYKDLPIIITRPFNYIGVGQSNLFVVSKIVEHFSKKIPVLNLGNIEVYREYNDVKWVCNIYLSLLLTDVRSEIINICTGKTFSIKDIYDYLLSISDFEPKIFQDPNLVRKNEIKVLKGCPDKLYSIIPKAKNDLTEYSLHKTLSEILNFKSL